jgi:hypothetical protein
MTQGVRFAPLVLKPAAPRDRDNLIPANQDLVVQQGGTLVLDNGEVRPPPRPGTAERTPRYGT